MLRVEASNLPTPIKIPRSRRLLPLPPGTRRSTTLPPHPEREASDPRPRPAQRSFHDGERWSVKLELGNEEIAKLYGQGMARGAVVWKKGMMEWRPLLVTPELSGLLRRTRITAPPSAPSQLDTASPSGVPFDDLTLPRPARLPYELMPEPHEERVPISTLAPMAADVEAPPPPRARRPVELAAVALGAFALAWTGHAALSSGSSGGGSPISAAAMMTPAPAAPAATACEPGTTAADDAASSDKSGIRTVSLSDLPLAGKGSSAPVSHTPSTSAPAHAAVARAARQSAASSPAAPASEPATLPVAPSRADLVAAMSQVARVSSSCGERGGPVRVVVTFASSGVARSIQVSGSDLPASTKSCIIGAASRARVSAFSGDPVTVSKAL